MAGALKGADNAVAITLGTGVGGGIIIDHKIYSGSNFAGAELGHSVIVVDGRPCTCGRHGCWETYASATGLIKTTKEHMEEAPKDSPCGRWLTAISKRSAAVPHSTPCVRATLLAKRL